jgi:putative transposase
MIRGVFWSRDERTGAMSFAEQEKVRRARAEKIGLFRYALIREAADPALTARARGALVRELAGGEHVGPFGAPVRVSRESIDRWIKWWRTGGFDALVPEPRNSAPRTDPQVLELALALKRENPGRDAVQIGRILRAQLGWAPGDRTLQRHLARAGLSGAVPAPPATVFGRFEAEKPNDLWTGDACHGPTVAGRKAILFAFVDDHSRMIVGARWGYAEDTVRLAAALRPALAARGIPESIYVDNGSAFIDSWLLRGCARLGIKLTHSTPGRPQGRGKIERLFGTVREEFLVEVTGTGQDGRRQVESLTELNRLFTAWSEVVYARRVHTETGQAPAERYAGVIPRFAHPDALAEAFRWSQQRKVTKVGTVSMFNNLYQVEPYLVGRTVDLVFDPFDLTRIDVVCDGLPAGTAAPLVIGRHSHPRARPEEPDVIAPATGIDYLGLIDERHNAAAAGAVNYAALIGQPDEPDATKPQATGTRITGHDDEPADLADIVSEVEI